MTRPARKIKFWLKLLKKTLKTKIKRDSMILLYHRIADVKKDDLMLSVSLENFEKHLNYLQKHFTIISLKEMVEKIKNNSFPSGQVAITFDDGYADNLTGALPILKKLCIPATIFVTAGKIGDSQPFYWDRNDTSADRGRPLDQKELVELASNPLITIGAHTVSHPHLAPLTPDEQYKEILESKRLLEEIIGKSVELFAYPFGTETDFNNTTEQIVKKSGCVCGCANISGYVTMDSNLFSLPRRLVRNWDLNHFKVYAL